MSALWGIGLSAWFAVAVGQAAPKPPAIAQSPRLKSVSLCDLPRHMESGLDIRPGRAFRIEGRFFTDWHSYSYVLGRCGSGQTNGAQFTHTSNLDQPGLELLREGRERACRGAAFCVMEADFVVEGELILDRASEFGVLIRPIRFLRFALIED